MVQEAAPIRELEVSCEEERFTSLLAAWDEMLAAGLAPVALDGLTPASGLGSRLLRGVACLQRLAGYWPTSPDLVPAAALPLPFTRLGRFHIHQELGRGGFGIVYRAFDPGLGREVALKVPRANALFSPHLQRRFQYEAQAAARLDHPHIVPVHEAGTADQVFYIASAYCPGPTLAQWLTQNPDTLTPAQSAELIVPLADAIQHAHSRGVLHRDLKPANILLTRKLEIRTLKSETNPKSEQEKTQAPHVSDLASSDLGFVSDLRVRISDLASGRISDLAPRVTDFGLAKQLDASESLSASDTVLGTPHYMAPEQAAGKAKDVGVAADVYALGAILYELLTGKPPFTGETTLQVLEQVRSAEPVPPRRLKGTVPADLEIICLTCLAKEPAQRYVSAGELAEDLRRHLRGEPIRARAAGIWERSWKWARRRPAAAALLAVLVLAVLGWCAGMWWHLSEMEGALKLTEQRRQEAERAQGDAQRERKQAEVNAVQAKQEQGKAQAMAVEAERYLHDILRITDLLTDALQDPDQSERALQRGTRQVALSQAATQLQFLSRRFERYPSRGAKSAIQHQLHERLMVVYHLQGNHVMAEQELTKARALEEKHPELKKGSKSGFSTNLSPHEDTRRTLPPGVSPEFQPPQQAQMPHLNTFRAPVSAHSQDYNDLLNPNRLGQHLGGVAGMQEFQQYSMEPMIGLPRPSQIGHPRVSPLQPLLTGEETIVLKSTMVALWPHVTEHRRSLAQSLHNRALYLWIGKDRPRAMRYQRQAADLLRRLHQDAPQELPHARDLAHALTVLAKMHYHEGDFQAARDQFEEGLAVVRRTFPEVRLPQLTANYDQGLRVCRDYVRNYFWCVAEIALRQGRHEEAAALAELLPKVGDNIMPEYQISPLRSVYLMARCIRLAEQDPSLSPAERRQVQEDYRQRAMRLIPDNDCLMIGQFGMPNVNSVRGFGWFFAHSPAPSLRDPQRALFLAKEGVRFSGAERGWLLLALAHYRCGNYPEAREAVAKSRQLHRGGDAWDWLLLALLDAQDGKLSDARRWQQQALDWLTKNPTEEDGLLRLVQEVAEKVGPAEATKDAAIRR